MDTFRLTCPYQWNYAGTAFVKPVNPGHYLGTTNKAGPVWLPHDENLRFRWKRLAGTISVAEWAWTFNFPRSFFLSNLWFKPFMMLEKEVTW